MDRFRKNLYTVENFRTINRELEDIDNSVERRIMSNQEYTNFLNNLLSDTLDSYHQIVRNLGEKKTDVQYIDNEPKK